MNDLVSQELEYRLALWQTLLQTGETQKANPQRLRELGIYGGAKGSGSTKTELGGLRIPELASRLAFDILEDPTRMICQRTA